MFTRSQWEPTNNDLNKQTGWDNEKFQLQSLLEFMHTYVHQCTPMYTHVHKYTHVHQYTHVHPCTLSLKDIYTISLCIGLNPMPYLCM